MDTILADLPFPTNELYTTYSPEQITTLETDFSWLVTPLYNASQALLATPFFSWLDSLREPKAFRQAASQLYYHSTTFPKIIGIMLGLTRLDEQKLMPFYASHAYGEADHSELLLKWMLKYHLLDKATDINKVIVTPETNACINFGYRMAIAHDRDKWVVGMNCGIERCSQQLFSYLAPKMRALGCGDYYFDIHQHADVHHSIMGLQYLPKIAPDSEHAKQLVMLGLEAISVWCAMLHSWMDERAVLPRFNINGELISPP